MLKFKAKPWITFGIQKSISIKRKLLNKFISKKDPQVKAKFHEKYKTYRYLLSTLMMESKHSVLPLFCRGDLKNFPCWQKGGTCNV